MTCAQSLRLFFCRWGDFVDLETSNTRIVRGGGGTGGLLTGARSTGSGGGGPCPVVYEGMNCDELAAAHPLRGYTCRALEREGLDCGGCLCASDECPVVRRVCRPPEGCGAPGSGCDPNQYARVPFSPGRPNDPCVANGGAWEGQTCDDVLAAYPWLSCPEMKRPASKGGYGYDCAGCECRIRPCPRSRFGKTCDELLSADPKNTCKVLEEEHVPRHSHLPSSLRSLAC